jgi:hypothetical protein
MNVRMMNATKKEPIWIAGCLDAGEQLYEKGTANS